MPPFTEQATFLLLVKFDEKNAIQFNIIAGIIIDEIHSPPSNT